MSNQTDKNWISVKKVGLPELECFAMDNLSSICKSKKVLVQTKSDEIFIAECRKTVYTNKKMER